jgi:hypothetical protein
MNFTQHEKKFLSYCKFFFYLTRQTFMRSWLDLQHLFHSDTVLFPYRLLPMYKNLERPVFWGQKILKVVLDTCRPPSWNLLFITLLAPRILRWLANFEKFCLFLLRLCYMMLNENYGNILKIGKGDFHDQIL